MRLMLVSLLFAVATGANAQTLPLAHPPAAHASAEIAQASHALAALWRPLAAGAATPAALETACAGAVAEMNALDEAMPDPLTAAGLAGVHPAQGLMFVPAADDPTAVFMFPSADLTWFSSGLGAITAANEATGEVALRDAGGHLVRVVIGRAAGKAMLRLEIPGGGAPITYVGCAPTAN
jgi:hypothetical protein